MRYIGPGSQSPWVVVYERLESRTSHVRGCETGCTLEACPCAVAAPCLAEA